MKSASVLNMSPSGRQLHFYSLTLYKLKLISWTRCLSEASAAGCRLLTEPAQKTLPSFHLIWGLDLIKDLQPSTPTFPPPLPCRLVKVALSWWVFARGSSDSPTRHVTTKVNYSTLENKNHILSHGTMKSFVDRYIHGYTSNLSLQCVGQQLASFQTSLKVTFSSCHWLVPVNKQWASTHLVSNVI